MDVPHVAVFPSRAVPTLHSVTSFQIAHQSKNLATPRSDRYSNFKVRTKFRNFTRGSGYSDGSIIHAKQNIIEAFPMVSNQIQRRRACNLSRSGPPTR